MRWQHKGSDKREWHKWYAWHPIYVNKTWVWLETVHRKWGMEPGDYTAGWLYRVDASN